MPSDILQAVINKIKMTDAMSYFKEKISEIKNLDPLATFTTPSQKALAAVKTIAFLFPHGENIRKFLDNARRANHIKNDDLEAIQKLLPENLNQRPEVIHSISDIIENEKLQLSAFITKPMTVQEKERASSLTNTKCKCQRQKYQMPKFKTQKDELLWLRKDHARLTDIIKQAKELLQKDK